MTSRRAPRGVVTASTVALTATSLVAPKLAAALRRRGVPEPVAETGTIALVTIGAWLGITGLERRHPFRADWSGLRDDTVTDAKILVLLGPTAFTFTKVATTVASQRVRDRLTRALGRSPWPDGAPLVVRAGLAVVLTELVHYWHHRWSHEIHLLWRFHAVHHSPDRLTWFNATRFHPVDFGSFVALQDFVLLALGIDTDAFIASSVMKGVHGQLQHANIAGGGGRLNHVFSTLDQHRWHHARPIDRRSVNYGAVLSVFDRIFGTQHLPDPSDRFDEQIGVNDERYGPGFSALMTAPFRSAAGD